MAQTPTFVSVGALVLVALSGCFGGGGDAQDDGVTREGEFKEFDLYLQMQQVELYPGSVVDAWLFGPSSDGPFTLPGPTIRATEGDTVRINFYVVGTMIPHTVHWHGLHVPWDMDGVPYVSQLPVSLNQNPPTGGPILNDRVFSYEFELTQSGTYFYHCHVDTAHHMDMGMYGAFIVDPADPTQDPPFDREYTLVLDEWDKSHVHQSPKLNTSDPTANDPFNPSGDPEKTVDDVYSQGQDIYSNHPELNEAKTTTGVKDSNPYYPAEFPAYFPDYDTYLINGKAYPSTEVYFIEPGEVVRFRVINAGFEWHALHLHGHRMYVTHDDGFLEPDIARLGDASGLDTAEELGLYAKGKDTISIGPAERVDFYVFGNNPGPWMMHDHVATNEMNDHVAPGGMMTMLCYTDGWKPIQGTTYNPCEHGEMSGGLTAGELLMEQSDLLVTRHLNDGLKVVEDTS